MTDQVPETTGLSRSTCVVFVSVCALVCGLSVNVWCDCPDCSRALSGVLESGGHAACLSDQDRTAHVSEGQEMRRLCPRDTG